MILMQGLIQVAFDIGIQILGTLVWVCPNLLLSKTETTIKRNSVYMVFVLVAPLKDIGSVFEKIC